MAKMKTSASVEAGSAVASKVKPSAPSKGRNDAAEDTFTSPSQRALSTEEIGHVAGDLWSYLDKDGAQTIAAIKKGVNAPNDLVLAAIGWLAREDKLSFSGNSRSVKISLR
jgi:hypothetical protein